MARSAEDFVVSSEKISQIHVLTIVRSLTLKTINHKISGNSEAFES